jgi:hypothetical protein
MGRVGRILIGVVAAAAMFAASAATAHAVTVAAPPASLGTLPEGAGTSLDIPFEVNGLAGAPTDVSVFFTATHGFIGDLVVTLIAPDGTQQIIFSRVGIDEPFENGSPRNLDGTYTFSDSAPASPTWWDVALDQGPPAPPGSYRASLPATGANTLITPAFSGLPTPNGTWTLRIADEVLGTGGAVSAATLTVTTPPPPAPSLTGTAPASPSDSTTPRVTGTAAGTQVNLYGSADCSGAPLSTGTPAELAGAGIGVSVSVGSTQISATATDSDAQVSSCSAPITYTAETPRPADTTAPDTIIKRKPTHTGPKHSHFAFRSSESGSTFRCSLDGARFRDCKSPKDYRNLDKGKHVFRVRATDPAGNTDATPARLRFRIGR